MKSEQSNVYTGLVNNEMSELNTNLNTLKQVHTTTYWYTYYCIAKFDFDEWGHMKL